jgi:hypothetical protein
MNVIKLLPVIFSFLLLAAHFLRAGLIPLVAIALLLPFLLFVRQIWVARFIQTALVLGALEWLRTLLGFIDIRQEAGESWTRLTMIIVTVAAFTGLSTLIFRCKSIKVRYKLVNSSTEIKRNN